MTDDFKFGLTTYRSFYQQQTTWIPFKKGGVTALVGPNNAGKSSLLRSIYELRANLGNFAGAIPWQGESPGKLFTPTQTVGNVLTAIPDPLDLVPAKLLQHAKTIAIDISNSEWNYQMILSGAQLEAIQQTLTHCPEITEVNAQKRLREIAILLSQSLYIGPYRNITNQANQGGATYYDLPIGESFIAQWRELKTGANRQAKIAILDTQRAIAELLGYRSLEINASHDGKTLNLVFDGDLVLSLADVGAGIAQLIFAIVTAANRRPSIILIDEPELHLHPTMQAKFVEALARYAEHGVVFATHSIGLARQVATQIFTVTRNKNTGKSSISEFENVRNSAQLLGEMSYSQFSAIGGQFLLLVEGTTEVRTFRVLLRKLCIDADVLIVPLGGSSLIGSNRDSEMSEFQRIGAEVFVLIDSERTAEGDPLVADRECFRLTCEKLFRAERVLLTQRRATENYMTDRAIKVVKSDKYRALAEYEQLGSVDPVWAKNENWKIADEMNFDEIKDTDLGQFLLLLQTEVEKSKQTSMS
jgi:ABC-type branched-subunit amino acid transport system ATPase component